MGSRRLSPLDVSKVLQYHLLWMDDFEIWSWQVGKWTNWLKTKLTATDQLKWYPGHGEDKSVALNVTVVLPRPDNIRFWMEPVSTTAKYKKVFLEGRGHLVENWTFIWTNKILFWKNVDQRQAGIGIKKALTPTSLSQNSWTLLNILPMPKLH